MELTALFMLCSTIVSLIWEFVKIGVLYSITLYLIVRTQHTMFQAPLGCSYIRHTIQTHLIHKYSQSKWLPH